LQRAFFKNKNLPKMKKIYLLFCLLMVFAIAAKAQKFIRIYDTKGHKIAKGNVVDSSCTDSVLIISTGNSIDTIPVQKVSYIKTKHSIGNNILVGAAIAAPTLAIVSLIGNQPCSDCIFSVTNGEAAASGFIVGTAAGAVIGAITGVFKNSKTGVIDGDAQKWHDVRLRLAKK
jgi:hypothetical protein